MRISTLTSAMIALGACSCGNSASAQEIAIPHAGHEAKQDSADAWWTGPLLTAGAETLPPGHVYFEPYIFDLVSSHTSTLGSNSYLLFGAAPRLTVGVLPFLSAPRDHSGTRNLLVGDLKLSVQYRLTTASPTKSWPTISVVVQPHFPTSRYDRLNIDEPATGTGNVGALVGVNSQQYFWLPNGRILRARLNFSRTIERHAKIRGRSSYGTPASFSGYAKPGAETRLDLGLEYSLTKEVVIAADASRSWQAGTTLSDAGGTAIIRGSKARSIALAPAVEYNWSSTQGVVVGIRWIPARGERKGSLAAVMAYSLFL